MRPRHRRHHQAEHRHADQRQHRARRHPSAPRRAAAARCTAHPVRPSTAKHSATHSTKRASSPGPSRASMPEMFWLVFSVADADAVGVAQRLGPVHPGIPPGQREPEQGGRHRRGRGDQQGAHIAAQQEVQQEDRRGRVSPRWPAPAADRGATACVRGTQSAITSVISTTLIWPNSKLARIGSEEDHRRAPPARRPASRVAPSPVPAARSAPHLQPGQHDRGRTPPAAPAWSR